MAADLVEGGERPWSFHVLQQRLTELEGSIHEYTVIDAELSSRRKGMTVYTRQASGLIFYKSDPEKTRMEHRRKLNELKEEQLRLQKELSEILK